MSKESFPYSPEAENAHADDLARHLGEFVIELFGTGPKKELEEVFHPIKALRSWRQRNS